MTENNVHYSYVCYHAFTVISVFISNIENPPEAPFINMD